MDVLFSIIGITLLLPLFLILAIAIKVESKGPVFFKQKRYGKGKIPFDLYKFRTMYLDAPKDAPTYSIRHPDQYIHKSREDFTKDQPGRAASDLEHSDRANELRRPRPVVLNEYDLIVERDKYGANDIRPGLTGWAQINGRDELTRMSRPE